MKILVTGGAGFIGSHVVDAYLAAGHEVVVIDNLSTGCRNNLNSKAKFIEMDVCDPRVREVFAAEKPDVLNHHAAQIDVRISVADPQFDLRVNVGGLINVMEAARVNGVKKVVFASSGGTVYGEQEVFPASESHPLRPISPYGLNKLSSEQYLFYYEKEYGIPFVALRYANIYGPRQSAHGEAGVVAIFISKMLRGEQPIINGDGKQTRDYVFVGDVVQANLLALQDRANGAYNVGTSVESNVNQLFHILRESCEAGCAEQHGPAKGGEVRRSSLISMRFQAEFDWSPQVHLPQGLQQTVEWFRSQRSAA